MVLICCVAEFDRSPAIGSGGRAAAATAWNWASDSASRAACRDNPALQVLALCRLGLLSLLQAPVTPSGGPGCASAVLGGIEPVGQLQQPSPRRAVDPTVRRMVLAHTGSRIRAVPFFHVRGGLFLGQDLVLTTSRASSSPLRILIATRAYVSGREASIGLQRLPLLVPGLDALK